MIQQYLAYCHLLVDEYSDVVIYAESYWNFWITMTCKDPNSRPTCRFGNTWMTPRRLCISIFLMNERINIGVNTLVMWSVFKIVVKK